jgi:hypothetical protein
MESAIEKDLGFLAESTFINQNETSEQEFEASKIILTLAENANHWFYDFQEFQYIPKYSIISYTSRDQYKDTEYALVIECMGNPITKTLDRVHMFDLSFERYQDIVEKMNDMKSGMNETDFCKKHVSGRRGIYEHVIDPEMEAEDPYSVLFESPYGKMEYFERLLIDDIPAMISREMDVYANGYKIQPLKNKLLGRVFQVTQQDIDSCLADRESIDEKDQHLKMYPTILPRYHNQMWVGYYRKK